MLTALLFVYVFLPEPLAFPSSPPLWLDPDWRGSHGGSPLTRLSGALPNPSFLERVSSTLVPGFATCPTMVRTGRGRSYEHSHGLHEQH